MIPSPSRLPQTRRAAIEWYRQVLNKAAAKSEDHILQAKARLSKSDLFYLLTVTCKRKDLDNDWLFDRAREVQAQPYDHVDLWARWHYKSTLKTFGLNVMEILNDPEITIGLFSDTNKVAKPFLRQIKVELETNDDLKAQFPDILWANPQKQAPKWSEEDGIVVKRKGNPKESTVEAFGLIDGQPTGRHFRKLDYDDVVTEETIGTPEQIEKVKRRLRMSFNLGAGENTRRSMTGTRYHMFDAYRMVMDEGIFQARIHAATDDGKDTGSPVFMSPAMLLKVRKDLGPYVFGSQMLLNPVADAAQSFKLEWLQYWPAKSDANLTKLMIVDPAGSKKRRGNDFTSMWVFGYGADEKWRVLDYVRDRLNLAERTRHVFALHRKWRPSVVGYEEYGLQADIEHMEEKQDELNYRFSITPLGGKLAKEERIKRLVPTFEQGRMLLPAGGIVRVDHRGHSVDVIRSFREEEYLAFPVLAHDDGLDSMSRIHDAEMKVAPPQPDALPIDVDDLPEVDWMTGV
jgi:phage terminase large subunit-like protein